MKRRIEKLIAEFDCVRKFAYRSTVHRQSRGSNFFLQKKYFPDKEKENIADAKTENITFFKKITLF